MNKRNIIIGIFAAFLFAASGTPVVFGQSGAKTQNVTVVNTAQDPVPVKVINDGGPRKRFQFTVGTDITTGGSGRTILYPVPAGKRLVIEHVSARTYRPPGLKMNLEFGTYFDNGDLFGDDQGLAFHGIALIEQGTELNGYEVSAASHDILAFAEDRLGTTGNLPIRVRVSLSGIVPFGHFARGTVVFTGYVEDNPPAQ